MNWDQLRAAYRQMVFIRAFELRLNELFLQGVVAGTTHLCVGQEACAVGVCSALDAPDVLFSNHRGHGHLLGRGCEPGKLMAEIFGSPRGYSGGRGGSQHIAVKEIGFLGTHGITAGSIPLAVGAALHKKLRGEPGIAVPFFSDGAVGQGLFHESLNMAAIWHLPVLFVCENNLYAMSSAHRDFSPVADIAERAKAYAMEAHMVDGNDVAAVHEVTARCRAAMTRDPHPVLLELKTFRVSGHSRGDACLYRTREEEADWRLRDPLERARTALRAAGGWDEAAEAELQADVARELATAAAFAKGSEVPAHA